MRILTKGITNISKEGNKIILTYGREEEAMDATNEIYQDNKEWIDKKYPNGIFN